MEEREIKIITKVCFSISIILGSIFLFFIWGISRVDATSWVQIVPKNDLSEQYISNSNKSSLKFRLCYNINSTICRQYTGNRISYNWNTLSYVYMQDATIKQNDKVNFEIQFTITAIGKGTGSQGNLDCNFWGHGAIALLGNRLGTQQTIANRQWARSSCDYDPDSRYSTAVFTLSGEYTASIDASRITFIFGSNIDLKPENDNYVYDITYKLNGFNMQTSSNVQVDVGSIINNQNANTQNIINGIEQGAEDIINNANQNAKDIMNNQNENTQKEIDSQKVCKYYNYDNSVNKQLGYINAGGEIVQGANQYYYTSPKIKVNKDKLYTITTTNYAGGIAAYCLYDINQNKISCETYGDRTSINITPSQDGYIAYSLSLANNRKTIFMGEYCNNGNQAIQNAIEDIQNFDNWEHENPDSNGLDDVEDLEDEIGEYLTDPVNMEDLDYEIDVTTNETIWSIFDRIVTADSTYLTTFLSILFCGIVKLILAR